MEVGHRASGSCRLPEVLVRLAPFGIPACTATPQDPPPSLAQHGSCRRSSTSSSLPFRTHVGAGNSAVVVDLPRWGPMLSPRVPNLVPIPGPRMERETPGQRPRPNYGHRHAPTPENEPDSQQPETHRNTTPNDQERNRAPTPDRSPTALWSPIRRSRSVCSGCRSRFQGPQTAKRRAPNRDLLGLSLSADERQRPPLPATAATPPRSTRKACGNPSKSASARPASRVSQEPFSKPLRRQRA